MIALPQRWHSIRPLPLSHGCGLSVVCRGRGGMWVSKTYPLLGQAARAYPCLFRGVEENVFLSSLSFQADIRDSVLLSAALDIARPAMKTVEEGCLSPDELLRMHRCTEVIQFLSAAELVPTKPEENRASLQPGESSSSIEAASRT